MLILTEEEFLIRNGASRLDLGDSALHKNKGNNSDKVWKKIIENQTQKDRKLIEKREALRKEYKKLVLEGFIRPPTREERLLIIAGGSIDNEATLAARRLLEKYKK